MRVAEVPTTTSISPIDEPRALVSAQPSVTPTMASGLSTGSRVSASETRTCTAPKESGSSRRLTAQ